MIVTTLAICCGILLIAFVALVIKNANLEAKIWELKYKAHEDVISWTKTNSALHLKVQDLMDQLDEQRKIRLAISGGINEL